jgi:hypothetical protein
MRLFFWLSATVLLFGGEFWNDKAPGSWTAEEKQRLLTVSPWAKTVGATLDATKGTLNSRIFSVPGGQVSSPQMRDRGPDGVPPLSGVVRWESAAPVLAAEGKPLPEEAVGHLVISVTMTGAMSAPNVVESEDEQLRATSLQAKGKLPVNPVLMMRDDKTGTIRYFFAKKESFTAADKEWVFETSFGPLAFKAKFVAREMQQRGKPAL